MLKYERLLERMSGHFARWMDIRKRVKTSNGGKVLQSIADEVALIQDAIDDYKKDFFLEGYIGKEEEIVDYTFRIHIGNVNTDKVKLLDPALKIVIDIKEFYADHSFALYQDGWLYIHKEHIQDDGTVVYEIYDKKYSHAPQLFHVWNVFDEFAAFLGLKRHEYETNLDLEKRIINFPKQKVNTTESGLKHAIITELLNIDPKLTADEIIIEGVTPENLQHKYKEFDTVLEALARINKDVYRLKKWDIDTWNYTYHSVNYIPHFWDVALDIYKNGVGRKDDLKIGISKETDKTNAVAMFYTKNITRASQILEQKKLTEEIELELTKYNDSIKPVKARYRMQASEALDITNEPIYFEYADINEISEDIKISDITKISDDQYEVENVVIDDSSTRIPAGKYKIRLEPEVTYSDLLIKSITVTEDSKIDLAKPNENFIEGPQGLIHAHTKIYANEVKDFTYVENARDVSEGIGVAVDATEAVLKLNLNGMQNERFNIAFTSDMTELKDIKASNFNYSNGTWESVIAASNISLEFETVCNIFAFEIEGKAKAIIDFNGVRTEMIFNGSQPYVSMSHNSPVPCRVKIVSTSAMETLKISNIRTNSYIVSYALANGEPTYIEGHGVFLPNFEENEITVNMQTLTSKTPILKHINVGDVGLSKVFLSESFNVKSEAVVDINAPGLKASIIPVDEDGNLIMDTNQGYIPFFNPIIKFTATEDYAVIYLDFKDYISVNDLEVPNAKYIANSARPYLQLMNNAEVSIGRINGTVSINKQRKTLNEIFNIDTEKSETLHVSNLFNGFICKKTDGITFIKLNEIAEYQEAFKGSLLKFEGLPNTVSPVFEEKLSRSVPNSLMSGDSYYGAVRDCYIHINSGITHIAYNEYNMFKDRISVDMIDTFHPFLEGAKAYLFDVEKITEETDVSFEQNSNKNNYSLGRSKIVIDCPFDRSNSEIYGIEKIKLPIKVLLNKNIALESSYKSYDDNVVHLNGYVITPPAGCEIQYITKPLHHADIELYPDIVKEESVTKRDDGYNKLPHCNINDIVYITASKPINGSVEEVLEEGVDYQILKTEGIIVWLKELANTRYYVKYTINKPVSITLSDDMVYEKIEYDINGYDTPPIMKDDMTDIADGDFVEISPELLQSDRIVVRCDKAGFRGIIEDRGIRFKRIIANDVVSIKSGYYYMDGIEYYMFAKEYADSVDQAVDSKFVNVEKVKNTLILRKPSNNYIQNSMLNLKGIEEIYNKDYTVKNDLKGISSLNAVTACDSFSHWISRGINLSFTDGKNGTGIKLNSFIDDGYMYLEITDKLFDSTKISMYVTSGIRAYIGVSDYIVDVPNTEATFIKSEKELTKSIADNSIVEVTIEKEANRNYFLIIKGSGIIDDIVAIDNNSFDMITEYHTKNIDILDFDIEETYPTDSIQRLLVSKHQGFKNLGAEIDRNDKIVNSPLINWGVTKIKDFQDQSDWVYCSIKKGIIENNMIVTKYDDGQFETEPIYLGEIQTIKNLIIKLNEIDAPQMTNMLITVSVSDRYDGTYRVLTSTMNNISKILGKRLDNYIKIRVDMPPNKVVHSLKIFAEYKTTDKHAPVERVSSTGTMLTHILDTHHQAYYEISDLSIEEASNLKDIKVEIRAAKENVEENVWTDWKVLKINDNLSLDNKIRFKDYRYFQIRVTLTSKDAYIKINHIDAKVVQD